MLDFLHIENVAVIKKLDIDFNDGFNVLTGETGAGKSIIIDSINMLLGSKMSKEIIRHGEERAVVSAFFSKLDDSVYNLCDELEISYDREDVFSVSRTITVDGKNSVKINSRPSTLTQLKAITSNLINIHGQNENQMFMSKAHQLSLIDEYSENDEIINEYSQLYSRLVSLKNEITCLTEQNKQKDTMLEILQYQIKEIASAKLKDANEEEKLKELKIKLKSSEKILKNSSNVYRALLQNESGVSAIFLIEKAIESLNRLAEFESDALNMASKLEEYKYEIEDIAERAKDFASLDGMENPERQLELVENRLAVIERLEKKYAPTIPLLFKFKEEAEQKLKEFENADNLLDDLKSEYKKTYNEACVVADKLHLIREQAAINLSQLVMNSLEYLDMPKVQFKISVNTVVKDKKVVLSAHGCDEVEFMIATNVGEELAPMSKIASGGELSRIMLAIKSAMSDKKDTKTIIFDEIDTGVSGSTSQKIGVKLATISKRTQVFCVTHSAQIASLAKNHYFIKKTEIDGRAETNIKLLSEEERVTEIARIIGGINLTEKQYAAANELINQSEKILKSLK